MRIFRLIMLVLFISITAATYKVYRNDLDAMNAQSQTNQAVANKDQPISPQSLTSPKGTPGEVAVLLTSVADAYDVAISINGQDTGFKGGKVESQLYLSKTDPLAKQAPDVAKPLFSLNEGRNDVVVTYARKPGQTAGLDVVFDPKGYPAPAIYVHVNNDHDVIKRTFVLAKTVQQDFKPTVITDQTTPFGYLYLDSPQCAMKVNFNDTAINNIPVGPPANLFFAELKAENTLQVSSECKAKNNKVEYALITPEGYKVYTYNAPDTSKRTDTINFGALIPLR